MYAGLPPLSSVQVAVQWKHILWQKSRTPDRRVKFLYSPTNNYRRSLVCVQCGDKTWLTSAIGTARNADLQCHLPRKTWRLSQRPSYIITSTTTS